jgi:hypothetical protein
MTTPAENTHGVVSVQQHTLLSDGTSYYTDKYGEASAHVRPASVNSPVFSNGFRYPTSWFHLGYRTSLSVDGFIQVSRPGIWPGWWAQLSGALGDFTIFDSYPQAAPDWMYDVAHVRALTALKGQGANLGVMFAERHETAELLTGAAHSVASQVRAYKATRPKDWSKVAGALSPKNGFFNFPSSWLQMAYGWIPLMSDVQGSCNALSKKEQGNQAYDISVKGKCKDQQKYHILDVELVDGIPGLARYKCYLTAVTDVTCQLWYTLDNPVLAAFSSLGLTNPLEIVWERVPYSFVVDWFLPVGNWLSALDADFGWQFKAGRDTEFARWESSYVIDRHDGLSGFQLDRFAPMDWHYRGHRMQRRKLSSTPGVGIPHFKNPFSSRHIANALALLVEAFRR